MRRSRLAAGVLAGAFAATLPACTGLTFPPSEQGFRTLAVEDYREKMEAGWLGQMVGVGYGAPTEFTHLGQIIPESRTPAYDPALVNRSWDQDDLYVEMTFLRSLEEYGLDVPQRQAGIDFANSRYTLWHGNLAARDNLRAGIAPPDSGHPEFNGHPDDIDFQIESDFIGLISPGLPQQSIDLGERFGRIVGYGDGVYGGQFMACLYSESFFTDEPQALIEAGLACIPEGSQYAPAVRDVVRWWRENPTDWERTWWQVNDTWHVDPSHRLASCTSENRPGFNIDAKLNGAYVVLGLLYGDGDPVTTMQVAMRAGQDSDCNPASAGGVLLAAQTPERELRQRYAELDREAYWSYTEYNFDALVEVTEELARASVVAAGGRVERDAAGREYFLIPLRDPQPLALEQSWEPGPTAGSVFTDEERAEIRGRRRG